MNTARTYGAIGLIIPILFVSTYLVMSSIRPEFSHLHKAISELGSLDAPNKWWWNSIGYVTTGALISVFAIGLGKNVTPEKRLSLPFWSLFLSGVFMSLSGVFPGDFDNRASTTMIVHTIGSLGTFLFFLIAAFTFPKQFRKSDYWKKAITPSIILAILCIVSGFLRSGDTPGLGQRIGFVFYFLWIGYLAYLLFKRKEIKNR